ncbi:unnamed protein product [Linum tenue]|uniref:Plant bHLH transcription factor ACT-like domain-containing protein n=1 Tax=Linum tenue TaxID=586396 RepID=A0AAV0KR04_9ROSI|nr:unnamed protein product [Linum tenue]
MGSSTKKQIKKTREPATAAAADALSDQFQLLRSITNSSAMDKTSIIVDATKYIEELKDKVERLSGEATTAQPPAASSSSSSSSSQNPQPMQGYSINVLSDKNSPGLLVAVLEAFDELGLEVLDATVSCSDNFQLQAVGTGQKLENEETMDAQMVKQAVQQAIHFWSQSNSVIDDAPHQ